MVNYLVSTLAIGISIIFCCLAVIGLYFAWREMFKKR
jgi:hypothetical protein